MKTLRYWPRREFLFAVGKLSLTAVGIFLPIPKSQGRTSLKKESQPPHSLSHSQFLSLSQRITGETDLDGEIAEKILIVMNSNSNKRHALVRLHEKTELDAEDQKLHQEILSIWYTGLCSNQNEMVRITYFGALMYRPTRELMNTPSACGGSPGYWIMPPKMEIM